MSKTISALFIIAVFNFNFMSLRAQQNAALYRSDLDSVVVYRNYEEIYFNEDTLYLEFPGKTMTFERYKVDSLVASNEHIVRKTIVRNRTSYQALIQPLITGKIELYVSHYNNKQVFYLKKGDGPIYFIPPEHFLNYVYVFFNDCEALDISQPLKMPERFTYTMNGWLQLVSSYNTCFGKTETSVIYYKTPPVKYSKQLIAGVSMTTVNMNTYPYNDQNFTPGFSPYGGLLLGVIYYNRLGFYGGIVYENLYNSNEFISRGSRFDDHMNPIIVDVDIKLDYNIHIIQLPLFLQFIPFQRHGMSLSIEAGGVLNTILLNKSSVIADDNYKPVVDYRYNIQLEEFSPGIYGGLTLSFPLLSTTGLVKLNVSNAFYFVDPITNYHYSSYDSRAIFTNYAVSAGIRF